MTQLKFNPHDLVREYAYVFLRSDLFGPKLFTSPFLDFDVFVNRARYLLTVIEDEHILDMFAHDHVDSMALGFDGSQSSRAAAWIVGLQKNRDFIACIDASINDMGPYHRSYEVFYAAGLLFEDPSLHTLYRRAFDNFEKIESEIHIDEYCRDDFSGKKRALAIVCLEHIDLRFGTRYAESVSHLVSEAQRIRILSRLTKILDASIALRAGFDFEFKSEFVVKLREFLAISTSFMHQVLGVTRPVFLRSSRTEFDLYRESSDARDAFVKENEIYFQLGMTIPTQKGRDFLDSRSRLALEDSPPISKDNLLRRGVKEYLNDKDKNQFLLRVYGRAAQDLIDILCVLECDLLQRLPVDFIDILFEKIREIAHFNAEAFEQYAYELLLRSNQYDEKASGLLKQASLIKQRIKVHPKYSRVWMSSDWDEGRNEIVQIPGI